MRFRVKAEYAVVPISAYLNDGHPLFFGEKFDWVLSGGDVGGNMKGTTSYFRIRPRRVGTEKINKLGMGGNMKGTTYYSRI